MEPQAQVIIRDYGVCRCCATKGNHRDITKEYCYNGIREVFYDIFVECFNLYLSKKNHLTTLICSSCISRLREASTFRMTVVSTEKQLIAAIQSDYDGTKHYNHGTQESEVSCTDLKLNEQETNTDDYNTNYDFQYTCDDIIDEDLEDFNVVEGEAEFLSRFNGKRLNPLPTRQTLLGHCPVFVKYLESLKGKIITPKTIKSLLKGETQRSNTKTYVTEKMANTINACTIFEYSNATAFKTKTKSGYPCFYCREIYDNIDVLRTHQADHPKSSLFKLLCKYTADSLVVYADVTDLKCTICEKNIQNLTDLKTHLIKIHRKRIYTEFEDRVIPFKLSGDSDFECQICRFTFETFGAVERHMNVHFRNSICEQCGAGFVTINRLKLHNQAVHKEGNFPCDICKKVYATYNKYKMHFDAVHNMLRKNKCPKCPERFIDYFTRRKHLVEKHGFTPIVYRCKVCDRGFSRRFSLSGHMKRCHLVQKDVQCEFCSYMCFTKGELKVHMLKHTKERAFECNVCKKTFARQKTMKEHIKVHEN